MKLNADQRAEFDREGYLFFPGLFTPEEANLLKAEADNVYALQREEVWRETSGVARTAFAAHTYNCLLYTSPSPRDLSTSRMPSSA